MFKILNSNLSFIFIDQSINKVELGLSLMLHGKKMVESGSGVSKRLYPGTGQLNPDPYRKILHSSDNNQKFLW